MSTGTKGMMIEDEHRGQWLEWLSAQMWWAALVVGGILCLVALTLS